jgi:hypothetical protein
MNTQTGTNQESSIDNLLEEEALTPLGIDALAIVGGGEGMICIH